MYRFKQHFRLWFFEGIREKAHSKKSAHTHQDTWWKVMCLTGVDYFSTLGYQPGIAFLAAGICSPIATVFLILLTLLGALPIYSRVARESPYGQGSIAMLEKRLPGWYSKAFVLCLLGFAATDFMITITLSAADAAAHAVKNPFLPEILRDPMLITCFLLSILGAVFLKGFREAIGVSVVIVISYLILNTVVIATTLKELIHHPQLFINWHLSLITSKGSLWGIILMSALVFPKLALGLSGFETGVAVMPLVKGADTDTPQDLSGRIQNTKKLLVTAAIIMAFLLAGSSLVSTILIPASQMAPGGQADGRALSWLAHKYLGEGFGTAYDISSILILWFAGASAMTGLLSLVPKYLPRYGMAPEWARATRPLVCFFTFVAFGITILFKANVAAQGGAYATGVLVLMSSASLAVFISSLKEQWYKIVGYSFILIIFLYTSGANIIERPDGIKIASFFIFVVVLTSLISRGLRSTELRVKKVHFDNLALQFVKATEQKELHIVAHRPGGTDYTYKEMETRRIHNISPTDSLIFLEVRLGDVSEFSEELLEVKGIEKDSFKILQCASPAVPNAIAAIMLNIRNMTGHPPHVYFGWTEGHPLNYVWRYIFLGEGETAPLTREVLRAAEPDRLKRPYVHAG